MYHIDKETLMLKRILKNKKGAALVEYALLVGGIALIAAASVSIFGHKTNDMIAGVAAILPGAHVDDNAPIVSGKIIETANGTKGIGLDISTIVNNNGTARLGNNLGSVGNLNTLVVEP